MKITSWDIKGFGRFKQYKVLPGSGFNIIFEENESGKSTLQAFFRAMLYGLKGGRRSKDGSLPPVKHYRPWNYDQYAGVLEYSLDNGQVFRIGRNFDKGIVNIYDGGANNLTQKFPQDRDSGPKFAEEHIGLDEATFERSVFFGQMQTAINDEGRKNLVEKLINMKTTGNEDISLARALAALESALLEKVGTGRSTTRPLDKINLRLSQIEQEKQVITNLKEEYLNTARALHEKKALFSILSAKLERMKLEEEHIKRNRLKALQEELLALLEQEAAVEADLKTCEELANALKAFESINENTVAACSKLNFEIEGLEETIERENSKLREKMDLIKKTESALEEEECYKKKVSQIEEKLNCYCPGNSGAKSEKTKKTMIPAVLSLSCSILMFIAYLAGGNLTVSSIGHSSRNVFTDMLVSMQPVLLAVGVLSTILFIIIMALRQKTSSGSDKKAHGILQETLLKNGFNDINEFLKFKEEQQKGRSILDISLKEMEGLKSHIVELGVKADVNNRKLEQIFYQAGQTGLITRQEKITKLNEGFFSFKKAQDDLRLLRERRASIEDKCSLRYREASSIAGFSIACMKDLVEGINKKSKFLENNNFEDVIESNLQDGLAVLESQHKETQMEMTALAARLEKAPSEDELTSLIEEEEALNERKERLQTVGAGLSLASEVLIKAASELKRDYVPELNKEMSRLTGFLTNGRYSKTGTNDDYIVNLEVSDTDELVPVSRLSGGTIDQIYFCMRLSAINLLEKERESLPIFMDEPFSQYDDGRSIRAFEILKGISGERQIFFFTCKEREYELAKSVFGESMNRIRLQG